MSGLLAPSGDFLAAPSIEFGPDFKELAVGESAA